MAVLSDLEILQAVKDERIICYPFNPKNIKGASLDVNLGKWFFLTDKSGVNPYFNPYSEKDVRRYFGEAKCAIRHDEWCMKHNQRPFDNIPPESLIIVLQPHERILAHTNEFVGIDLTGTTQMQARSTIGRLGIVVCKDAGWGDPGYQGRWTMEIQNDNNHHVPLVVGSRVAQIVFVATGPVMHNYSGDKYYKAKSLRDAVRNWRPEDMLPRLYMDAIEPLAEATVEGVDEYEHQIKNLDIPEVP